MIDLVCPDCGKTISVPKERVVQEVMNGTAIVLSGKSHVPEDVIYCDHCSRALLPGMWVRKARISE